MLIPYRIYRTWFVEPLLSEFAMIYDGKHVMVDAVVTDDAKMASLNNPEVGRALLEGIVDEIDMTMILPVITVQFPHNICEMRRMLDSLTKEGLANSQTAQRIINDLEYRQLQSYGYSSLAMIAESHLSIHTFPEERFFTFDCYSCKDFDDSKIRSVMLKYFGECEMHYQSVPRRIPGK
jgi:S-adenosylmethionine decarboxylase